MARVFSQKHSSTSVGNVGINSVGTKSVVIALILFLVFCGILLFGFSVKLVKIHS